MRRNAASLQAGSHSKAASRSSLLGPMYEPLSVRFLGDQRVSLAPTGILFKVLPPPFSVGSIFGRVEGADRPETQARFSIFRIF